MGNKWTNMTPAEEIMLELVTYQHGLVPTVKGGRRVPVKEAASSLDSEQLRQAKRKFRKVLKRAIKWRAKTRRSPEYSYQDLNPERAECAVEWLWDDSQMHMQSIHRRRSRLVEDYLMHEVRGGTK